MSHPTPDSTIDLSLLRPAPSETEATLVEIENEVIGLFDEFQQGLLRYARSLGLSAPDGEDIVQEAFLSLFRHLRSGKPRHNLRGWIFRVTHNLALKRRHSEQRLQISAGADGAGVENQLDPAVNPEEQLAWSQRKKRLLAVLNALPTQDRACLCLRAEGLRYREIAEVLGISLGAVSNSLAGSFARLARADQL